MKKRKINSLKINELTKSELNQVNGGNIPWWVIKGWLKYGGNRLGEGHPPEDDGGFGGFGGGSFGGAGATGEW